MNYFIFKNIDSRDIKGLIVQELPPISKPAKKIERLEIDGKDGDIIEEIGYQAYDKIISIGLTRNYDINQIISWLDGSGELILSNEPDKYYNARIIEEIDFERLVRFKTAKIKIHIQPFKYKANEEYSLVKDRKDKTVSGTSIDINDSAEMRINELKISGNSRQETRSGKNLLKFTKEAFHTQTINGVTITNNEDGSFTLNGISTGAISVCLSQTMYNLKAGNYYLSRNSSGTVSDTFTNILYGRNGTAVNICSLISEEMNVIAQTDYQEYYLWLYIANGITFTNYTMKPQLEAGTVKTDWELYGSSPSPDYPSPNESCGDNINIYDGESETGNIDASTGQNSTSDIAWRSKNYINVKDTSISISAKDLTFSGTVGRLYFYKNDNTYISNILINSLPFTATLPNETAKVRFFILNSVANINTKIKVEQGITPTPYSPYGQGCINEVICNKNIFNKATANIGYTLDGTKGTLTSKSNENTSDYTIVSSNESYTISGYTGTLFYMVIAFYDKYKNLISINSSTRSVTEYTFKTPVETKYIRFNFPSTQLNLIQLEKGIKTDYEEHKEQVYTIPTQQPFRAIENYKDTFIKKNNKWYERHYIKREILKGTENWIKSSSAQNGYYTSAFVNYIGQSSNCLSNMFKMASLDEYNSNADNYLVYINNANKNISISLPQEYATTVEEFKTFLQEQYNAGTPVYVDYILETPIDIECTEEQSTILWDIEQNAKTYDKVTHIYSTDNVSPVIDVTYFTPTNETINNEGNIQSRPILRLEKTVSEAVELTINDIRFKYNFNNDEYVEIDCEEKTVEYEGLNRNRSIEIGYDFPKLKIGNNDIKMHDEDCKIKILRKDRWL